MNSSTLAICFHPDFSSGKRFREVSRLDFVFTRMGMNCWFPNGDWVWRIARGWRDKDTKEGELSNDVYRMDSNLIDYKYFWLVGHSDGAGMANYYASYRSRKVLGVFSLEGRLQRDQIATANKYPVWDLWNGNGRHKNAQHQKMVEVYKDAGHEVTTKVFNDNLRHGRWNYKVNDVIEGVLIEQDSLTEWK